MADRMTDMRSGEVIAVPVAASTVIEAGKMVARNSSGYAVPAADAAGLVVLGKARRHVDNGSGADGDAQVTVRRKAAFKYANSSTNAVTRAHVGTNIYVEDAQTVASSGGTNSIVAGKCIDVESDGVWVEIE